MSVPLNLTSLTFFCFPLFHLDLSSNVLWKFCIMPPLPLSFYGLWICNYWGPGTIINTLASQILHVCFILPKFLILVFIYCLDCYCLLAQVSASCSVQCPCTWRNAPAIMTTQRMFSEWIHCALSLWTQLFHKPCSMPCIKASLQQQCQPEELTPHPPNPQTLLTLHNCTSWVFLSLHIMSALSICRGPCSLCIYLFICSTASHWASVTWQSFC